jgi:hypothetical protein
MNAFCMMCGKPLAAGIRFCGECGAEAQPNSATAPASPVAPEHKVFSHGALSATTSASVPAISSSVSRGKTMLVCAAALLFILVSGALYIEARSNNYAEGEYHLNETWKALRLKPGPCVRHYTVSGGSVRFKSRLEGPEYRLVLGSHKLVDLQGHQLSVLDPESPDAHAYNTSSSEKWVRCEDGDDCVLTIFYTQGKSH